MKIGFSAATVLPLTLICLSRNFWTRTAQLFYRTHLSPQIWNPATSFFFFFFPKLKLAVKGRRHENKTTIQKQYQVTVTEFKTHRFLQISQQWYENWDRCIKSQDNYAEGYRMD